MSKSNQRHAGKSSTSQLLVAPLVAIGVVGALTVPSCQGTLVSNKTFASHTDRSYSNPTELIAAKPSRHTLAFFAPNICLNNNQRVTSGTNRNALNINRCTYDIERNVVHYDGSIEPNKIALVVNKLRLLLESVKTRRPISMGDQKLTKLIGGYHA